MSIDEVKDFKKNGMREARSYLKDLKGNTIHFSAFENKTTALIGLEHSGRNSSIRLLHEHINKDTTVFINVPGYRCMKAIRDTRHLERFKDFHSIEMPTLERTHAIEFFDINEPRNEDSNPLAADTDFNNYKTIIIQEPWALTRDTDAHKIITKLIDEGKHTIIFLFLNEECPEALGLVATKSIELCSQAGYADAFAVYDIENKQLEKNKE